MISIRIDHHFNAGFWLIVPQPTPYCTSRAQHRESVPEAGSDLVDYEGGILITRWHPQASRLRGWDEW